MSPRKLPYLLLLTTDPHWFRPSQTVNTKQPVNNEDIALGLYLSCLQSSITDWC